MEGQISESFMSKVIPLLNLKVGQNDGLDTYTLNSFTWGKVLFTTWTAQSIGFLLRTMASDLEMLILITAAAHSTANRSSGS